MPLCRSRVEIDLLQLKRNLALCRAALAPEGRVMAVVKADAYGHGHAPVARTLQQAGVESFAVSNIQEAIELRVAGIVGDILILGYTPPDAWRELQEHGLTQTLISAEYAAALWEACHTPLRVQFAVDTGMHRIGLSVDDPTAEDCIRRYAARFAMQGIFTHLSTADGGDEASRSFARGQIAAFEALAARLADLSLSYVHCLNSAGALYHTTALSRTVRLGIVLYGLAPAGDGRLPAGILPALSFKSVIAMIKTVGAGEGISYGRTKILARDTRVATVPVGYADGYPRALSGKGYALVCGRRAPILGRVCMDMMMLDVTDIPDLSVGETVTLIGRDKGECITADDLGKMAGTVGYEILCGISSRVPRLYR